MARDSLSVNPTDLLLERRFFLNRGFQDWRTRLWAPDASDRPIAWFSAYQVATPFFLKATRTPVKVYGVPSRGAVVVVSCEDGVLVGRIDLSRVEQDDAADAQTLDRGAGKGRLSASSNTRG